MPLALLLLAFACPGALVALSVQTVNGQPSVDLEEVARSLGMNAKRSHGGDGLQLSSRWTEIEFKRNGRDLQFNGTRVFLGNAVTVSGGRFWISTIDYERSLQPLLMPQAFSDPPAIRRILLDPGHGGRDPGTVNEELRLLEKHLTLDLAKRVQRRLEGAGYTVMLTRSDDRFLSLGERAAQAKENRADLFLSLHFNAAGSRTVEGVETYTFTPRDQASTARTSVAASDRRVYRANRMDPWNILIGYELQHRLKDLPRAKDRGLRRARFAVLRDLDCPAVLIEGGFVSHPREGRDIGSAGYRDQMAEAIAAGVTAFDRRLSGIRTEG